MVIIGGGMVGLSLANQLIESDKYKKLILVEKESTFKAGFWTLMAFVFPDFPALVLCCLEAPFPPRPRFEIG